MKRIAGLFTTLLLLMTLASCDSRKTAGENPFFTEWDTPHGVPPFDKILPEHFMPAFERGMSLHEAEIDAITSNKDEATFENTILAYDNAGQMLAQTELVFGMLCAAETNDRMQALQEQAMPLLAAHRDKIRLDDKLFVRVKEVYDRRAALGLDAEQMRLLQKTYDSFVRAGALLDAEQKARLKEINGQLSLTAVKFGNNILAENNNFVLELKSDELDGLPAGIRDAAREKAQQMGKGDKWVFTLHKPSLIPLLTYSTRRDLREKIYKAYLNRCNNGDEYDNKQLINDFIRLRTEKAHLLGYPSYAAYVVADEMAGTTDAVYGLDAGARTRQGRAGRDGHAFAEGHPRCHLRIVGLVVLRREAAQAELCPRRGDAASLLLARERAGRHLLPGQPPLRHHLPADRRAALPSRCGRLRGARCRWLAPGCALFRLFPPRRQEPGRLVRQLCRADL